MLVLNLPFKALMFLTLMRPSLVLFLVLWLKLVKDFLKVRCRLALLPFLISCLIWLDLVASLPLIKERILVIILLMHFLSLMLGSVMVLMLPLLVWFMPGLRIKKSLLKCNWTIRKRLPRCTMRLKKRLLAFSRRHHARVRKTRYMHTRRGRRVNRTSPSPFSSLSLMISMRTPPYSITRCSPGGSGGIEGCSARHTSSGVASTSKENSWRCIPAFWRWDGRGYASTACRTESGMSKL